MTGDPTDCGRDSPAGHSHALVGDEPHRYGRYRVKLNRVWNVSVDFLVED